MGRVWWANDEVTRTSVALKILKELPAHAQVRKRLLREAKAVTSLDHPHVVKVFDALESDDGSPMLVMELLVGESLGDRLKRDKELSVECTAAIMAPVVSAVGAAHARGIVHRDLKPENIFLLRSEMDPPDVKVLDFGIAKLMGPSLEATPSTLTVSGHVLGTPRYMAPEQAFGDDVVDHRADIWALGLILYQCLTGILPTNARSVGQIFKILLTRKIWPLRDMNPNVPADLAAMVDRMLARSVRNRPTDLREVLAVLAAHTERKVPRFGPAVVGDSEAENVTDDAAALPSLGPTSQPSQRRAATWAPSAVGFALGGAALALVFAASTTWRQRAAPEPPVEKTVAAPPTQIMVPAVAVPIVATAAPRANEDPPLQKKPSIPRPHVEEPRRVAGPVASLPAAVPPTPTPRKAEGVGLSVELDNPYPHK
jgi:serine/threonine protein kinase